MKEQKVFLKSQKKEMNINSIICTVVDGFKNMKTNRCPYCRSSGNYLPVVNGLKKVDPKIHINDKNFKNEMCGAILTRGPNKGKTCGKNCQLGFQFCKTHLKQSFKKETEKQLKG